jgi:hypothetical protein
MGALSWFIPDVYSCADRLLLLPTDLSCRLKIQAIF